MGKEPVPAGSGWAGKTVTPPVLSSAAASLDDLFEQPAYEASRRSRFAQIPQRTVTVRPGP